MEPYVYRAKISRVIDGDTVVATVDLGFHLTAEHHLRLLGINSPELHSKDPEERKRAMNARGFTDFWVNRAIGLPAPSDEFAEWPFLIKTSKSDSFGRWLTTVWSARTGEELNQAILSSGNAVPFHG